MELVRHRPGRIANEGGTTPPASPGWIVASDTAPTGRISYRSEKARTLKPPLNRPSSHAAFPHRRGSINCSDNDY